MKLQENMSMCVDVEGEENSEQMSSKKDKVEEEYSLRGV